MSKRHFLHLSICKLFILISLSSYAQTIINTASISHDLDSALSLVVDVSGSFSRGNADINRIKANTGIGVSTGENSSIWLLSGFNELRTNSDLVQQSKFLHGRFNYELRPRIIVSAFTQYQSNLVLDMKSRVLLGTNLGFGLDKKAHTMLLTGVFYEAERYLSGEEQALIRLNIVGFTEKKFEHFEVVGFMYFQPNSANFSDFRYIGEASLRVPISSFLQLSTNFVARYDSSPHSSLSTWDTNFNIGLRLELHKSEKQ